jgi:hypothetical protein
LGFLVHAAEDVLDTAALLDRTFDSICRPLKVRIEQVSSHGQLLRFISAAELKSCILDCI